MHRWNSSVFSLCLFISLITGSLAAEDTAAKLEAAKSKPATVAKKSARPDNLQPLYRFYNHEVNEHLYSLKMDEIEEWRKKKHFDEHAILGDVSPIELPGTVRLSRAPGEGGRHYFYVKPVGAAANAKVKEEQFRAWVWPDAGDGRIPIFGHAYIDATDTFLEPDLKHVSKFREDSKYAMGIDRLSLSEKGDETPLFYVYPHVVAKKPAEKETAKADPAKAKPMVKELASSKRPQPLYRFYNHALNEHLYSLKKEEIEEWRKKKHFDEHAILGDASPVELPGTARLWRAFRDDGKHYFYFRSAGTVAVKVDVDFKVWVWMDPGDGRIPIYGHTWIDDTDVFLEPNLEHVTKFRNDSQDKLGVSRLSLAEGGDETPIFYLYPHVVAEKPEDPKSKAQEKKANP
jgi:hypothetical protein